MPAVPHNDPADLGRRAQLVRHRNAELATAHQAFTLALAVPCTTHNAKPGHPCWSLPSDSPSGEAPPAVCGHRSARSAERVKARSAARAMAGR